MLRAIFAVLALTAGWIAAAQPLHQQAWIVTPAGDTVHGFVAAAGDADLHLRLKFSPAPNGVITTYTPAELRSFGLHHGNRLFLAYPYLIVSTSRVSNEMDTVSAFLEVLSAGKASLLRYHDHRHNPHYFLTKNAEIHELRMRESIVQRGETNYRQRETLYNNVFNLLLLDCGVSMTYKVPYGARPFQQVVDNYNQCTHSATKSLHPITHEIYLGGGVGLATADLQFGVHGPTLLVMSPQEPKGIPAYYDISHLQPSKMSESLLAQATANLVYSGNRHISLLTGLQLVGRHWQAHMLTIDLLSLEIPSTVNYTIGLRSNFRPFIGAGMNLNLAVQSKMEIATQLPMIYANGTPVLDANQQPLEYRLQRTASPAHQRPTFVAGFDYQLSPYQKLTIMARFERSVVVRDDSDVTSLVRITNFSLGYSFRIGSGKR